MKMDPKVWGPHYWFFLHTIAFTYPKQPNAVIKKKYYELIQNLPLFIPTESASSNFEKLLNLYPVTPYLDTKDTFIRWTHFIHNKINEQLEKPSISLSKFYEYYYSKYKPNNLKLREHYKMISKIIYITVIIGLMIVIYFLYHK